MARTQLLEHVIQPAETTKRKCPPLPWWVILYFRDHQVGLNDEDKCHFSNGLMRYDLFYDKRISAWTLSATFLNEDMTLDLFMPPVFHFTIPPTEEKFRTVMQVLDIQ